MEPIMTGAFPFSQSVKLADRMFGRAWKIASRRTPKRFANYASPLGSDVVFIVIFQVIGWQTTGQGTSNAPPFGVRRQSASDDGALDSALAAETRARKWWRVDGWCHPKRRGASLPAALQNASRITHHHSAATSYSSVNF